MNAILTDTGQDAWLEAEDDYLFDEDQFIFYTNSHFLENYITSICVIFAVLVAYFSTVLVCYVIHKFEIVRTRTNYILANFFISATIFSTFAGFSELLVTFQYTHIGTIYFIVGMKYALYMTTVLMIMLLAFDWYSSVNWPTIFLKWQKTYKCIVATCYLPCVGYVIPYFTITKQIGIIFVGTIIFHFIALVFAITISVHKKRKMYKLDELKTFYTFASAELWMFAWSFCWISTIDLTLFDVLEDSDQQHARNVFVYMCHFFYCFGIASIGLCLFFLKRWDKHFSMAFEHTFKRSLGSYIPTENHIDA